MILDDEEPLHLWSGSFVWRMEDRLKACEAPLRGFVQPQPSPAKRLLQICGNDVKQSSTPSSRSTLIRFPLQHFLNL